VQSLPQARRWRAPATLAQAGLAIRARAVVSIPAPEVAPIRAQAVEPTQALEVVPTRGQEAGLIRDQVVVYTRGRVGVLTQGQVGVRTPAPAVVHRLLRVVGATAGLAVVARISGIGRILIVSQSRSAYRKAFVIVTGVT
jgi:hypothetical protein